ncbi:MAG: ribosome biogenesis GTP-binding protein YihA/YsxC [Fusobacteriaceae bacterium]|jgi:GTP-binding protein|nr:ribosome biogenesis GTP-binding protein YihA/YsxC [Fusobacteriaceae bacterium]
MTIKQADFVKSAVYPRDYPPGMPFPEFAFIGRSNVGKSSLINSLTGRKKLAKTSKTPGRTQLINYFLINRTFYVVDLPGYGFAKVSKAMRQEWNQTISSYLASPRNKLVFVLLDIRRVPGEEDLETLRWLAENEIPYRVIFTKMDKVSGNERTKCLREIGKKIQFEREDVFFHSSLTNAGRDKILEEMERILNNTQEMQ